MNKSHKLAEGIVRVWDEMNPEMDMIVMFSVEVENAERDVLEAWDSWYSEEASDFARGDWMFECLAKKYGEGNFEFFYHENWIRLAQRLEDGHESS